MISVTYIHASLGEVFVLFISIAPLFNLAARCKYFVLSFSHKWQEPHLPSCMLTCAIFDTQVPWYIGIE